MRRIILGLSTSTRRLSDQSEDNMRLRLRRVALRQYRLDVADIVVDDMVCGRHGRTQKSGSTPHTGAGSLACSSMTYWHRLHKHKLDEITKQGKKLMLI